MNGWVAAVLAALSAALAVAALALRVDGRMVAIAGPRRGARVGVLAAIGTAPVARRIRLPERARALLAASGGGWTERGFVGAQITVAAIAVGVCAAAGALPMALPLGALAWRLPSVVLSRRAARRLREIDREVPVLLDLLAVATSAGLPPQLALRRTVEVAEGPLAGELDGVVRATDLGGRWRDELAALSERLAVPDLARTAAALTRSEALGSSLAEEVGRLAADVREARRAAATERARAAPVKMLFPLVFLVLPAFLLLTVVPVLVATVESIR